MPVAVPFQFFGSLQDFLNKRDAGYKTYHWQHSTSIKDAIEALGVPHVEVGAIRVNKEWVSFNYHLQPEDSVKVYPNQFIEAIPASYQLRPTLLKPYRFILDVHLGSLARLMRLMGFNTLYETEADDPILAQIAAKEQRILLTRDIGLLKHKIIDWGYWLRSQHTEEQFKEVINRFSLNADFAPFTYCLACNGLIKAVAKEDILHQIPSNSAQYFHQFFQCQHCERIYWKGSHYERMLQTIERLQKLRAA
jgi:uncharacterized protein with PIN domain